MCPLSLLVQLITLFQLLCHCPRLLHAMHQCITGNIHWPFFHSASLILETKERFFLLPLKALFQVSLGMPRSECVSSPSVAPPGSWPTMHCTTSLHAPPTPPCPTKPSSTEHNLLHSRYYIRRPFQSPDHSTNQQHPNQAIERKTSSTPL